MLTWWDEKNQDAVWPSLTHPEIFLFKKKKTAANPCRYDVNIRHVQRHAALPMLPFEQLSILRVCVIFSCG